MATLLALDTATEACSVALLHNNKIIDKDKIIAKSHGDIILPMIDSILADTGLNLKQIDAIVFGQGPGSFTGVRIGISVVQGLALGANLPIIPISNLTAMAHAAYVQSSTNEVLVAMDARMNEVYFSKIAITQTSEQILYAQVVPEQVISPDKLISLIENDNCSCIVGTGWNSYQELKNFMLARNLTVNISYPSAKYMLQIGQQKYNKKEFIHVDNIQPVYLRNQVTWKKIADQQQ